MTDDWNELRLVLAVVRGGGLVGAARLLGVDHSTVFRRVRSIEARLDQPLFERLPGGAYEPTQTALRMAAAGERMEDEALALARDIAGGDRRLTGTLKVTSSETLAFGVLTPQLAAFRAAHPGIMLELVVDNRLLSLTRREADVALRPARPHEGDLWGRKLADVAWTLYGTPDFVAGNGMLAAPSELARHPVIGWDDAASGIGAAEWLDASVPEAAFVLRTSSLVGQLSAAKAGIGLALLPCYLGDPEPDLSRVLAEPVAALARELWLVTHKDLRQTARVRAFFDLVGDGLASQRALFEGRRSGAVSRSARCDDACAVPPPAAPGTIPQNER